MTNYYTLVSTHLDAERDSFYINTQLPDQKLSIGWGEINPINQTQNAIKAQIEDAYPDYKGTVNPDNGAKSLTIFTNLQVGDVIFVRGIAKILDVVIITGQPFIDGIGHYDGDYYLKVPFTPLFSSRRADIDTARIPGNIYNDVLYEGGRSIVLRRLTEGIARKLLTAIMNN